MTPMSPAAVTLPRKELQYPHQEPDRHEAGTLQQISGDSSSRFTHSILLGDVTDASPAVVHSSSEGVAPNPPHHEAASTRYNLRVEAFRQHARQRSIRADPPATSYTNRDPFQVSEEVN